MTQTDTQILKSLGYLPLVELKDLSLAGVDHVNYPHVFSERKCGHPDHPDPEIADADPGDLSESLGLPELDCQCLISMHLAFLDATTGRGSFPSGCHPDLFPDRHAIKYYVDYDSFPDHYKYVVTQEDLDDLVEAKVWGSRERIMDLYAGKIMLDVAFLLKEETYRRVGCAHVRSETLDGTQIHVKSRNIPGSTIGIGWFNNGTCSGRVEYHIDSTWRPNLASCSLLLNHECGHCNGLPHTFSNQGTHRGVMSYSWPSLTYGYSTGKPPHSLPVDPSMNQLVSQYGDEPIPSPDDEPIPPLPAPPINGDIFGELVGTKFAIRGTLRSGDFEYIVVPKHTANTGVYVITQKPDL